ncbi:MAG TPA: hypothetical protein PKA06_05905, partial [Gemmatales bacterium]|nr:hypothetical protein [Gemmatales bacterium]
TAAGCLSLSLARVGLFLAYGLGCWYAMKRFAPEYAIPVICVCAGGLFSVFFYRFCVILLTSSVGSLMVAYGGMAYAEQSKLFSALPWPQEQSLTLHGALAGFLLTTMVVQLYTTRRLRTRIKNECTREELESERRLGFSVKDRAA